MAKIKTYTSDTSLAGTEKFIGSDTDGTTLNYTISDLGAYMAGSGLSSSNGILAVADSEATAATIAAGDFITFLDGGTSGTYAKGSINDVATLFAGTAASTGLSASSGVLTVSDLHSVGVTGSNNQLLTDDGDGTVTSESNLTFTGSVLAVSGTQTITSTTADQLKVLYDGSNYALLNVGSGGALEIETIGAGTTDSHLTLNVDGDIILNADAGNVYIKDDTATHFNFDCDNTQLKIIDDTDANDYLGLAVTANGYSTIVTNDNDGVLGHLALDPDGNILLEAVATGETVANEGGLDVDFRIEAVDETHMIFVEGSSNRVSIGDSVDSPAATLEVTNHASAGAYNVPLMQLNSNDTDKTALDINAANIDADVINITANALTTQVALDITANALTDGGALKMQSSSSSTNARNLVDIQQTSSAATACIPLKIQDSGANNAMLIDHNTSGVAAQNAKGLYIDFDRTVAASGTANHNDIGIDLDVNSATKGTGTVTGMDIDVVGAATGTHSAIGIDLDVDTAGSSNIGMLINTAGTHMKLVANADTNDYATIALADTGDLTITTVGSGTVDSDMALTADGKVTITPADITGDVFHLDANADTDNIVNIDAGALDVDASAAITIDGVGVAIGAGSSELDLTTTGALDINGGATTIDTAATTVTTSGLLKFVPALGIEIENADGTNLPALLIDNNDEGEESISITDIGFRPLSIVQAYSNTTAATLSAMYIDLDKTGSSSSNNTIHGLFMDLDNTTATDGTNTMYGIYCTPTLEHAQAAGTPTVYGAYFEPVGHANGTSTAIGLKVYPSGADTNVGVAIKRAGAVGSDLQLIYSESGTTPTNYCDISTGANGATTIATTDSDGAVGHLTLAPDGLLITPDKVPTLSAITDCAITLVAGTEYVVNDADGGAMVLPAAAIGSRITINIGTLITSNTITITAAATDQLFKGYAFLEATDAANNKTYFAPDGSDDDVITLNGGTTGGLIGDKIELVGISTTEWRVRATLSHTGSAATPFS